MLYLFGRASLSAIDPKASTGLLLAGNPNECTCTIPIWHGRLEHRRIQDE